MNKKNEVKLEKDALKGVHILLVEDEELINRMYNRILEKSGATIDIAYDGLQAISLLKEPIPDIILLDLMMPRVNGFEFLRSLRSMEKLSGIPVIIISNLKDRPADIKMLSELGISDFLTKSDTSLDELVERIKIRTKKVYF